MEIGFIGLGVMGANMARQLQRKGHALIVFDLDRARAAELEAAGARVAESAADCAQRCRTLITSLPGPPQVEAAMERSGALAALPDGGLWIDMTTNDTALLRRLADREHTRGVRIVDAPVTGAVDGARRGELTIFAGGDEADLRIARTPLEAMGRVIACGALGSGNAVKLVTNFLWFTHAAALGEALMLGKRAGVALDVLWAAIKDSVGDSFVARHDAPSIFAGHYDPSFTLDLCVKDLGLIARLAELGGVPLPVGDAAAARFALARETYGGGAGELHVAKLIEDAVCTDLRLAGDWPRHWEA